MQTFPLFTITASQLMALIIHAAKNGRPYGVPFVLDFCLRKSAESVSRARGSTKYEVLVYAPWFGENGGAVFLLGDETGKLLAFKFEQFGRWLAKMGAATVGVKLQTNITLLDLSDLGRPLNGQAAEYALAAFQQWAGGAKLQSEIDKYTDTLASWGVTMQEESSDIRPPYPPNYSDWWQIVGAGAVIGAEIVADVTGQAVDLQGEEARGIFEAAKGGRSSRSSEKKQALAIKLAILKSIQNAQNQIANVIENDYWGDLAIASGGFSDSGENDSGGGDLA